jgi:NADP-dependent 3-hydroxy acid dehydrogenase YdfG
MNYGKTIVFGSTSSIAKLIIPKLEIEASSLFTVDRSHNSIRPEIFTNSEKNLMVNFSDSLDTYNLIVDFIGLMEQEPILVLNFSGYFGEVASLHNLDIDEALSTVDANLRPYLMVMKIGTLLPPGSLIVSFAGAGVGGSNLDDSSFGYLASKASLAILNESIDKQLERKGVRSTLISPGAFVSQMQNIVANANEGDIPTERIANAKKVMEAIPETRKLISIINFLKNHPEIAGGRMWSANFDLPISDERVPNFGRMRRIFE